jgi:phage shock protein C
MNHKHLYRSIKDKKIAGVAGGLAEYLNIDSTFVRLLCLVSIFIGGGGVLAYIIAWIAIPQENPSMVGDEPQLAKDLSEQRNRETVEKQKKSNYIGLLLIVVGVFFMVKELLPWNLARYTWPFILITLGIFLLVTRRKDLPRQ